MNQFFMQNDCICEDLTDQNCNTAENIHILGQTSATYTYTGGLYENSDEMEVFDLVLALSSALPTYEAFGLDADVCNGLEYITSGLYVYSPYLDTLQPFLDEGYKLIGDRFEYY